MDDHTGSGPASASIAEQARAAAAERASGQALTSLKEAVQAASPDERSAAAKELVDDRAAYESLHKALEELGIEPSDRGAQTD